MLGRWESATEWAERTEFTEVTDIRAVSRAQSATLKRYEMAQRNGLVERVALQQNAPNLPFKNAPLAASVSKTVKDFEQMPVTRAAVNVVFDALVESRNGLIPPALCDERRARMMTPEGGLDDMAFSAGTYRGRGLVILSWFLLGKGQVVGLFVGLKIFAGTSLLTILTFVMPMDWAAGGAPLERANWRAAMARRCSPSSAHPTPLVSFFCGMVAWLSLRCLSRLLAADPLSLPSRMLCMIWPPALLATLVPSWRSMFDQIFFIAPPQTQLVSGTASTSPTSSCSSGRWRCTLPTAPPPQPSRRPKMKRPLLS